MYTSKKSGTALFTMVSRIGLLAATGLVFLMPVSQAQDFSLFEELDTTSNTSERTARTRNNRETRNTPAAPEFTLVGTSRFGDTTTVLLSHRSDEIVRVELDDRPRTPIPGYESYAIINAGAGQVAIQYPGSTNCQSFEQQGVSCDDNTNIASLELTTLTAIRQRRENQSAGSDQERAAAEEALQEELNENTDNPFATLRARAAEGRVQALPVDGDQSGRFVPRRYQPEEVPPGMRVISTPFGDRLVEQ